MNSRCVTRSHTRGRQAGGAGTCDLLDACTREQGETRRIERERGRREIEDRGREGKGKQREGEREDAARSISAAAAAVAAVIGM